jgi:hypothetical protein
MKPKLIENPSSLFDTQKLFKGEYVVIKTLCQDGIKILILNNSKIHDIDNHTCFSYKASGCCHLKMNMHTGIKPIKLMTTAISS